MVALEGRWEGKKKKKNCFHIPKRVVDVFFFLSFIFIFGGFFWFLVFNCRVTRVARGVFLGVWALGGVGVGVIYNMGQSFALDWTYRYMLPFFY